MRLRLLTSHPIGDKLANSVSKLQKSSVMETNALAAQALQVFRALIRDTRPERALTDMQQGEKLALTLIAGLIPARLAAKKDPVVALRSE